LRTLDLSANREITDAAVPVLARLAQLRVLKIGQTGITPAGAAKLQQALAGCQISGETAGE
jgi:hypothetical protein